MSRVELCSLIASATVLVLSFTDAGDRLSVRFFAPCLISSQRGFKSWDMNPLLILSAKLGFNFCSTVSINCWWIGFWESKEPSALADGSTWSFVPFCPDLFVSACSFGLFVAPLSLTPLVCPSGGKVPTFEVSLPLTLSKTKSFRLVLRPLALSKHFINFWLYWKIHLIRLNLLQLT